MSTKTLVEFDLDRYLRASKKVDLSHLDWGDVPSHPLSDGDIMCLHYMMDIETHTVVYLRDLLGTRAVNDPQITAFLACWVYEELWHGEAFSDFLRAYGIEDPAEPRLPDGSTPRPTRPTRTAHVREQLGIGHRLGIFPTALGSLLTKDFVAIHMTWGAINELTTLTSYHQLIRRSDHPVLHQMLRKVIQDERRHFAFYRAQAKARLTGRPRAGRLVRRVLERLWTPVGVGAKAQEEFDALALYLAGYDEEGREALREVDTTIGELPGLEGLRLLEDALDTALAKAAAEPGYAGVASPELERARTAASSNGSPPASVPARVG